MFAFTVALPIGFFLPAFIIASWVPFNYKVFWVITVFYYNLLT